MDVENMHGEELKRLINISNQIGNKLPDMAESVQ